MERVCVIKSKSGNNDLTQSLYINKFFKEKQIVDEIFGISHPMKPIIKLSIIDIPILLDETIEFTFKTFLDCRLTTLIKTTNEIK